MLKKDKLRYNEYFDMQSIFDELYQQSRNNNNFYKLMEVIGSKQNIRLAYRNLKGNTGSKTKGTDGKTIEDISKLNDDMLIKEVRARLEDYKPLPVRRVYIPKPGSDKKRPLGIPTIWDRLIQQCILQVLEPICEPKFHNHSYGFRPNRSTHHAVSRMVSLINLGRHYYCVDIDIKGFFDNVNHGKLMKQIWNLGIRDKRLLCIISKLLKCEIEGEGIPTKGTPQGGILSPLLSNIVLNELDWWISDQWETYMPRKANLRQKILEIQNHTNAEEVKKYNSAVTGIQNYYRIATNVYNNLTEVDYALLRTRNNRLRKKAKIVRFGETPSDFKKKTTGIRDYTKIYRIMDIHMLPITGVHHKSPMNFSQEICNYTEKGRKKIHNNQRAVENSKLKAFQMILNDEDTIEFRNNMVSKFVAQYGKCYITGNELEPENAVGIRIKPKERNGTDDYNNIVIVSKAVIPLIEDIDADYCSNLSEKQKVKLNRLRRARKLKPVKGTCKLA